MIRVLDIWTEAKNVVGNVDDEFLFRRITDAVELLSNKGDWDPLLQTLDICTSSRIVTLPPEVETILACNMVGNPAVARDELFQFHINGPGQFGFESGGDGGGGGEMGPPGPATYPFGCPLRWEWADLSDACTYRELPAPSKLIAYCVEAADVDSQLWVHGLDQNQNVVRTKMPDGTYREGWQVPVAQSYSSLPADAPTFFQITAVQKQHTAGPIRLATTSEMLLGVYQPKETTPAYRRIQLSRSVPWVRIRFRRRTFDVVSKYDLLPLNSRQAVLMMLRALKAYGTPGEIALAEGYEATAVRWLTEKQFCNNPPVVAPLQVHDGAPLMDMGDFML
jgi:hypothetical protein